MRNVTKRNRIPGSPLQQTLAFGLLGASAVLMSGCNGLGSAVNDNVATAALKGSLHGGQQPISGATLQIYTVGISGIGSASTPIAGATTTSAANGTFGFAPGSYSCSGATQVYLVARGGNSGAGVNNAITMMAPLGSCSTLLANAATTFISVNEVTTVAGVYALAPFMVDYTHVGANGANALGMVNAMATANNLANISTGTSPGTSLPPGAVVPVAEINTLADILAACVNTNSASSSGCAALFSATGATDTLGAMLAIAKNPGSPAITALYTLPGATPPFQPTLSLSSAPNDFSVAIKYVANGGLNAPYGIAIDGSGNAWITNEAGTSVSVLNSRGTVLSANTITGLVGAKGIAIDRSNNVWVANTAGDSILKLTVANSAVTGANAYLAGAGNAPVALAIDSAGNVFSANYNSSTVSEISNSGTVVSAALTGSGNISQPGGLAIDASGNVLVANSGTGKVVKLTNAGVLAGTPYTDSALQGGSSLTLDGSGNIWMAGSTTGTAVVGALSEYSSTGVPVASSPLPSAVAALGYATADTSSVWVANHGASGGLLQFQPGSATAVSPATGFGQLNGPVGVAVDPSGNVWTANSGDNSVSQFVGLGKPVTTPIAANVGP